MNPEVQRSLWLDATPRRLVWAGVTVVCVFIAVWLVDRGRHAYAVTLAGAAIFFAAALMWAPRAARSAVTAEVRAKTWDFQRLSALSPWEMTWGKLMGATLRPWVIAGAGLAIAALQLASTSTARHAGFWVLVALGLAVTLQAAGLATGLLDIRRSRASGRPLSARAPGLLLLALGLLTLAALLWTRVRIAHATNGFSGSLAGLGAPIGWAGHSIPPLGFAAASLVLIAAWALVWAWRLMRLELQMTNAPWAWCGFVLFAGLYAAGFDPPGVLEGADVVVARLAAAGLSFAALAYVAAFAAPADRVRARQFAASLRVRNLLAAGLRLPIIVLPSALGILAGLLVALTRSRQHQPAAALLVLAMLAFFVRDLGLIAWRRFARSGAPGDIGVIATLMLLYVIGAAAGQVFGGGRGHALFWPGGAHPRLSLVSGLIQAAVAWGLAGVRIARPALPPRQAGWRRTPADRNRTQPDPATPPAATEAEAGR